MPHLKGNKERIEPLDASSEGEGQPVGRRGKGKVAFQEIKKRNKSDFSTKLWVQKKKTWTQNFRN